MRNDYFALGIQALNEKTLGGYPSEENDVEPSFDIFATGDLADLFTGKIPVLSHGKNTVVFDTEFSGGGNSVFKIEMKTTGHPESVKSEN